MDNAFKINRYLPIIFLYFFVNGLFLPTGLFYTTILCPLFILFLLQQKKGGLFIWFFGVSIPYLIIHFIYGVNTSAYLKSYGLLFTVFTFCSCAYLFFKQNSSIPHIYRQLVIWNFILVVLALLELWLVNGHLTWDYGAVTPGADKTMRLKMFASEASVYALIFSPVAFYYYLKMLLFKVKNAFWIFIMITLPLWLSISFGVILGLLFTFIFLFLSDIKLFFVKQKLPRYILAATLLLLVTVIVLIYVYPDNLVFQRFVNVFEGTDSSFKGRTTDAFYLGYLIADMKSLLFGAGLGQIKELGMNLFTEFYVHDFTKDTIAIPNAAGETIAIFGLFGFFIRFAVIIYLFFKTRVFTNYYRLGMFIFIFIYQFTGSYITNIAEYIIWIIAFTPGFAEFDKTAIHKNQKNSLTVS